jgi:TolB protein
MAGMKAPVMDRSRVVTASCCALVAILLGANQRAIAAKLGIFQHHSDVGVTPVKGKVQYDAAEERYAVTGGGANMWLRTDAFQFVYKKMSGDMSLTADVQFVGEGVEQHRKAALMIRQSLDSDSAYADVAVHGDGLTSLQYRTSAGETTQEMRSDIKAPMQIRIVRQGDQFTIAAGKPGEELQRTGPVTIRLKDPVYVGLAVCSHNANVTETAIFSKVQLSQPHSQ